MLVSLADRLNLIVWKNAHRCPQWLMNPIANIAADATWLLKTSGVKQLQKNLSRVKPEQDPRQINKLARLAMRSYFRYFAESLKLPSLSQEQIAARVRLEAEHHYYDAVQTGNSVQLTLMHMGNWDLAGAYATRVLAPVTTVAERLKPAELYEHFLTHRENLGLKVLTAGDPGVFRQLLKVGKTPGQLICLLADRDLSANGVEAELFGHTVRVAAGPAALALAGITLLPTAIYYEKLRGQRRKKAGSSYGIVVHFHPQVTVPEQGSKEQKIKDVTGQWLQALSRDIARAPQDWHMLQKVFVEDLDQAKYQAIVGK